MLAITGALAACVVFAFVLHRFRVDRVEFSETYTTNTGGYLRVSLPDESVLELNAQSDVRVEFTAGARRLVLGNGEAHFTVAKNPSRPFIVRAGSIAVRAVGTAFNVRLDRSEVEVLVTEGRVSLGRISRAPHPDLPALSAGQSIRISEIAAGPTVAPSVNSLEPAAIRAALSWQLPRLVFVETPLSEVVEQFNQRNHIQLEIGDPELGRRPVGGTFRSDRVETFVQLLEKSGDVAFERPNENRIVLRKAR
jgi:transmembrane sensor